MRTHPHRCTAHVHTPWQHALLRDRSALVPNSCVFNTADSSSKLSDHEALAGRSAVPQCAGKASRPRKAPALSEKHPARPRAATPFPRERVREDTPHPRPLACPPCPVLLLRPSRVCQAGHTQGQPDVSAAWASGRLAASWPPEPLTRQLSLAARPGSNPLGGGLWPRTSPAFGRCCWARLQPQRDQPASHGGTTLAGDSSEDRADTELLGSSGMAAPGCHLASGLQIWTAPLSLAGTSLHTDVAHAVGAWKELAACSRSAPTPGPWLPRAQPTPSWASGPAGSRSAPKGALRTDAAAARPAGGGKSPATPDSLWSLQKQRRPGWREAARAARPPALAPAHLLQAACDRWRLSSARLPPSPGATGLTLYVGCISKVAQPGRYEAVVPGL